jgi:plasmid stability protein
MSRVIQLRNVPDELHDALREGARAEGLSLNKFALRQLTDALQRRRAVAHNQAVIRQARVTMREIGVPPLSAEELAAAVREERSGRP